MGIKNLWKKTSGWVKNHKSSRLEAYKPQINSDGLINVPDEPEKPEDVSKEELPNQVVVKTVSSNDKTQSIEKLQKGFDKLIEQLQGINEHLTHQVTQHDELMGQMQKLPEILEGFPAVVENQKQLTEQLMQQLNTKSAKDEQFMDAVERIPTETAKQTDALVDINHQLGAAADADVQIAQSFNKFNETLDKLNQSTTGQSDSITQMSRTFATSDRYLKYLMSKQNKRVMWMFIITAGVLVVAVSALAGIILYIMQ